jgi:hypothetical protein
MQLVTKVNSFGEAIEIGRYFNYKGLAPDLKRSYSSICFF